VLDGRNNGPIWLVVPWPVDSAAAPSVSGAGPGGLMPHSLASLKPLTISNTSRPPPQNLQGALRMASRTPPGANPWTGETGRSTAGSGVGESWQEDLFFPAGPRLTCWKAPTESPACGGDFEETERSAAVQEQASWRALATLLSTILYQSNVLRI